MGGSYLRAEPSGGLRGVSVGAESRGSDLREWTQVKKSHQSRTATAAPEKSIRVSKARPLRSAENACRVSSMMATKSTYKSANTAARRFRRCVDMESKSARKQSSAKMAYSVKCANLRIFQCSQNTKCGLMSGLKKRRMALSHFPVESAEKEFDAKRPATTKVQAMT